MRSICVGKHFFYFVFFFDDPATTEIYTLSLHDALPICLLHLVLGDDEEVVEAGVERAEFDGEAAEEAEAVDRKSTRLNSSHLGISYAVFCLKKKKKMRRNNCRRAYIHRLALCAPKHSHG